MFEGVYDIDRFLELVVTEATRGRSELHACAVVTPRVHLLVRSPRGELSRPVPRRALEAGGCGSGQRVARKENVRVAYGNAVVVPRRGADIDVELSYERTRHPDGVGMYFVPLDPDHVATPVWWYGEPGTFQVRLLPGRYEVRRGPEWDLFRHHMAHPHDSGAGPPLARFEVPTAETVKVRIE